MNPVNLQEDVQKHPLKCCFCGGQHNLQLVPLLTADVLSGWLIACKRHVGAIGGSEIWIDTRPGDENESQYELTGGPAEEESDEEEPTEADPEPAIEPDDEAPF